MAVRGPKEGQCTKADARIRLVQAEAMLSVAQLAMSDSTDAATAGVAAALAVLAGIAASDAACCAKLGKRPRGQHNEATAMLKTLMPHGPAMAKDLGDLVAAKDDSHYGLHLVSEAKANLMLKKAERLTALARSVIDG
jgi:hypothetical protein